jgi:hypothetical protein
VLPVFERAFSPAESFVDFGDPALGELDVPIAAETAPAIDEQPARTNASKATAMPSASADENALLEESIAPPRPAIDWDLHGIYSGKRAAGHLSKATRGGRASRVTRDLPLPMRASRPGGSLAEDGQGAHGLNKSRRHGIGVADLIEGIAAE